MGFYDPGGNSSLRATETLVFSPVTLNQDWPKIGRLLFLVAASVIGATLNGFFVSSFFVEHSLRRIGNVFQGCLGMADLFITCGVLPMASVVLLSGEWDHLYVCKMLQFLTESSTYCYSLFFLLIAAENYVRICRHPSEYERFLSMRVGLVSLLVTAAGVLLAGSGVGLQLDYDYCSRRHYGHPWFRIVSYVLFHGVPCVLTVSCLTAASLHVKRRSHHQVYYRRSKQFVRDSATINLNITAYIFYVVFWIPFLVVSLRFPGASDAKFYYTAWVGVARSLLTSAFFGLASRTFRRAYAHLFNYCCCKSTLSGPYAARARRSPGMEMRPVGDVRVHILHHAVSASPQRAAAAAAARDTYEL